MKVEAKDSTMVNAQLVIPETEIAEFCRRWKVTELALFGSALRGDFRPDSDVDVLISFDPGALHPARG
jgi:predicted nucleotidyltransferase